jgi:ribosomal-protein-serine acetyltransferase
MEVRIEGALISARSYQDEHIDALYEAVQESIPEVGRYETWCHDGYTRDDAAQYVNWWRQAWGEGSGYYFAIEEKVTGWFLGSCGLNGPIQAHKRAGLGYWMRSSRTGHGFGTDAARTVLQFGFEELRLERIEMEIAVDNAASLRIADKLGFQREGILRHRLILPAGPTDMVMCARLRDDV